MEPADERFLKAVSKLGVVPSDALDRVRAGMNDRRGGGDRASWAAQELLKRTELTPRQVAEIQRALKETKELVLPAEETHEAESAGARRSAVATLELGRAKQRRVVQEPRLGQTLGGRFRLNEELGRGAQGIVYKAFDEKLDRDVAVKVLRTDAPGQARERFEREARTVSQLGHPGIVKIFEAGTTEGGALYYAMELVRGPSLEAVLESSEPLSMIRVARILEGTALAIHHAHEAGLVHRDLKPGNLLLDEDEQTVRVADFGLVSLAEGTRLTMTRGVVGTPVYMAPEQAEGQRIDRRADVYSLGAILYECLVGEPPFGGATPLEIFRKIVSENPVPPRSVRPELPELVERVCLRALEKDPRARYPTAASFARDLRRAIAGLRLAPEKPGVFVRRRVVRVTRAHPLALGFLLGLLLGTVGTAFVLSGRSPLPAQPSTPAGAALSRDALAQRAENRTKLLTLARQERARGLESAAIRWLNNLGEEELRRDPAAGRDVARARGLEALAWVSLHEPDRAHAALAQAVLLAPDEPLVRLGVASLRRLEGDWWAGYDLEQLANEWPLRVEIHLERAWLASAKGDLPASLAALDRAIELTGARPWPVALMARVLVLEQLGKTEAACWDAERLLRQQGLGVQPSLQIAGGVLDPSHTERRLEELVAAIDSRVHTRAKGNLARAEPLPGAFPPVEEEHGTRNRE